MLTPIPDLPDTTVGFTAHGKVRSEDYEETLIPAIEQLIARTGKARVLLVLGPEWEGYSAGAMFDDAKLGLEHLKAWERFALVSDAELDPPRGQALRVAGTRRDPVLCLRGPRRGHRLGHRLSVAGCDETVARAQARKATSRRLSSSVASRCIQ